MAHFYIGALSHCRARKACFPFCASEAVGRPHAREQILNGLYDKYAPWGTHLDVSGFRAAFQRYWPKCTRQFLKLETLFEYVEVDNPSWDAFVAGDVELSRTLLKEGLSRSIPFYERVRALGIDSHRVRPVRWPLTRYTQWEFHSYEESIKLGQRISLYDAEYNDMPTASGLSDFIVFDDFVCMLHRYSESGALEGAILVERSEIVREVAGFHANLAAKARPFAEVVEFGPDQEWHLRVDAAQGKP
jgi:hypothetical protein